jgi:creatinine amidohydrolase/Fe(II)-dependent formamide hydrolase-like protein
MSSPSARVLRVFVRLLPWLWLGVASGAIAQASPVVQLADLTWPELQQRIRAGTTTVLVPIGGTEQNGPHMVLGKHNRRVLALSERIAVALGDALVAPVIAYVPEGNLDPPTSHMRYPGTITVPDATFEKVLEYAARSFRRHGFRDIVLLGDHGGYQRNLRAVALRMNRELAATPVRVHAIDEYFAATQTGYPQALRSRGYTDAEIGTHAGLADTALALAVDPGLVRIERLRAGTDVAGTDGVNGDPRRASAELGRLGVDAIVTASTEAIRRTVARR